MEPSESPDSNETNADSLKSAEESGNYYSPDEAKESEKPGQNSLYTSSGSKPRKSTAKKLLKQLVSGNGKKIVFGSGGVIGAVVILSILFIFIAAQEIPGFVENIIEFEFARVATSFNDSADALTNEKAAYDAETAGEKGQIDDALKGDPALSEFEDYNPQVTLTKLGDYRASSGDTLAFNSTNGRLTSITSEGTTLSVEPTTSAANFLDTTGHSHTYYIDSGNATALSTYEGSLDTGLGTFTSSIRGPINEEILSDIGIGLVGWDSATLAKDAESDQEDADVAQQQLTYEKVNDTDAAGSPAEDQLDHAAEQADTDEAECVASTSCVESLDASGATAPASVVSDVESAGGSSILDSIAGGLNVIIPVAVAGCIIYSGSVNNSGSTTDANDKELEREAYLTDSSSDQEKAGHTNARAVASLAWKIGHESQSNAYQRASGQTVDTANDDINPQEGASTDYSLLNVVLNKYGIPSVITNFINSIANGTCRSILNPEVTLTLAGLGLAGWISDLFDGGATTDGEEAAGITLRQVANNIADKITTRFATKAGWAGTFKSGTLAAVEGGAVAGLTLLARQEVYSSSGLAHNGLSNGVEFDNEVDAGNNLSANQLERVQYFGRPLTNAEAQETQVKADQSIAYQNSQKSAYQRYFAFSNYNSLTSKLSNDLFGDLNSSSLANWISNLGMIFEPNKWFGGLFGFTKVAQAATDLNINNQDYGILQWGWSNSERQLIKSSPSYQPLENSQWLDNHPVCTQVYTSTGICSQSVPARQEMATFYGACFGLNQTGQLDLGETSVGDLLSGNVPWITGGPEITRSGNADDIGDVEDTDSSTQPAQVSKTPGSDGSYTSYTYALNNTGYLCSPHELGPNNPTFGQTVFRWRLYEEDINTLDQLTGEQNAT